MHSAMRSKMQQPKMFSLETRSDFQMEQLEVLMVFYLLTIRFKLLNILQIIWDIGELLNEILQMELD